MTRTSSLVFLLLLAGIGGFFLFRGFNNVDQPYQEGAADGTGTEADEVGAINGIPGKGPGKATNVKRQAIPKSDIEPVVGEVTSLSGRVLDANGQPLARVKISCGPARIDDKNRRQCFSAADGSWQLTPDMTNAGSRLHVRAELEGRVPQRKFVAVSPGEKKKVEDFVLPLAAMVEGLVLDEFGVPVKGAEVSTGMFGNRNGTGSVKSDELGRYQIKGVKPGDNRVSVDAKGFALAFQQVQLAVGPVPTKVDFTLSSGLSISGRVVDGLGNPVVGSKVSMSRQSSSSGVTMISISGVDSTKTDKYGRFRLANLEKSKFQLSVQADGFLGESLSDVEAGSQGLLVKLGKGGGITGCLLLPDGKPATEFTVKYLRSFGVGGRGGFLDFGNKNGKWDFKGRQDGSFLIEGLRAGKQTFKFIVDALPGLNVPANVVAGEKVDLGNLQLCAAAGIDVLVVDGQGQPIARAMARAKSATGDQLDNNFVVHKESVGSSGPGIFSTKEKKGSSTDNEGRTKVSGLAPGSYTLFVYHEDYAPQETPLFTLEGGHSAKVKVVLDKGGSIALTVRGRNGESPADQSVWVKPVSPGPPGKNRVVKADEQGRVRVDNLAPGAYKVYLDQNLKVSIGGAQLLVPMPGLEMKSLQVEVVAGQVAEVELQMPGKWQVFGSVVDQQGPVDGAQVTFAMEGMPMSKQSARTGPDGGFTLKDVAPGRYLVKWGRQGCAVKSQTVVELEQAGGRSERNFTIPSGSVSGRVFTGENIPGVGFEIRLTARDKKRGKARIPQTTAVSVSMVGMGSRRLPGFGTQKAKPKPVLSDEEGGYLIKEVPPGKWLVTLHHPQTGKVLGEKKVEVAPTQKQKVKPFHTKSVQ